MRLPLVLALLALSGCSLAGGAREPAALADARARWAARGPDDYSMTLARSCFCPRDYAGPFRVTVRDGAVERVLLDGAPVPADRAVTVEGLFDLVAGAYAEEAARVDVAYDPALGFPATLYVDRSPQIADEEVGYTVTDLVAE